MIWVHNAQLVLGASLLLMTAGVSAAPAVTAQQPGPSDPLVVVESFLAARNARDPWGATAWCADLLELRDADGQWFIEPETTSDWLRQLTDRYILETMSPLTAEGNTVKWSERLTLQSGQFPDAWSKGMTLDVSAVVGDGRITFLGAPYPALPLRRPAVLVGEPGSASARSTSPAVGPATLFVVSAVALATTALLAARLGPAVGAVLHRRRPSQP